MEDSILFDSKGLSSQEFYAPYEAVNDSRKILEDNQHLQQNTGAMYAIPLAALQRTMTPAVPRWRYRRRKSELKTVNHWGQRKLLLSEIEFLLLHGSKAATVVYAGAAPGTHLPYLASLFPEHRFVAYDPAPFNIEESQANSIEIRQEFFTDEVAASYSNTPTLFICDIRTADWKVLSPEEVEEAVKSDQEAQQRWVKIMNPKASMLKFRLPWKEGTTQYLKGEIQFPVWGPQTTTETRLIVSTNTTALYDNKGYEERMFFFNTSLRVQYYDVPLAAKGLDGCYDCAAEVAILAQYVRCHNPSLPETSGNGYHVFTAVAQMINDVSVACSPHGRRDLSTVPLHPSQRRPWFPSRHIDLASQTFITVSPAKQTQSPSMAPRPSNSPTEPRKRQRVMETQTLSLPAQGDASANGPDTSTDNGPAAPRDLGSTPNSEQVEQWLKLIPQAGLYEQQRLPSALRGLLSDVHRVLSTWPLSEKERVEGAGEGEPMETLGSPSKYATWRPTNASLAIIVASNRHCLFLPWPQHHTSVVDAASPDIRLIHGIKLSTKAPGMVVGAWLVADEVDGKCHPKVLTFDLYHLKGTWWNNSPFVARMKEMHLNVPCLARIAKQQGVRIQAMPWVKFEAVPKLIRFTETLPHSTTQLMAAFANSTTTQYSLLNKQPCGGNV